MKTLPPQLLQSLEGISGFQQYQFVAAHENRERVTSLRLNPLKQQTLDFSLGSNVPWSQWGYYLNSRPSFTFDPLFHAGLYYVQEASSMFLEQAFLQLANTSEDLKVLDLCAAPGGKSTHILSLLSENSLLVSNEVIRSRSFILKDNLVKWGYPNALVSNNDPAAFQLLPGFFDVIVVDAPCSGSGLFRRDEDAIDEWSPANVQLCSQRQQRILADALPGLKEDGLLIYSTCSYSEEEDECISDWLVKEMEMEPLTLELQSDWNIISVQSTGGSTGYRFFPHLLKGEGLYMACFRKKSATGKSRIKPSKPLVPSKELQAIMMPWMNTAAVHTITVKKSEGEWLYAITKQVWEAYGQLAAALHLLYVGVEMGQIMKGRLVPSHALALSSLIADQVPSLELTYETAIHYLQKAEMDVSTADKGWQVVRYKGCNLGWVNVLPNRINNYYPKELRILKQRNDSGFEK